MAILVRIEAVDFDASITDANDLSMRRGAGLANLIAPRSLAIRYAKDARLKLTEDDIVMAGASICLFWLDSPEEPDAVAAAILALAHNPTVNAAAAPEDKNQTDLTLNSVESALWRDLAPVLPFLRFAVAAVEADPGRGNHQAKRLRLLAAVRLQQLQTPSVVPPKPVPNAWKRCKVNPNLPAAPGSDYSPSVAARRKYGLSQKQALYDNPALGIAYSMPDDARFANDLEDLVWAKPGWVRHQIANKVAHVYLDGNNFTKIREALIADAKVTLAMEREFSQKVTGWRGGMLREWLTTLNDWSEQPMYAAAGGSAREGEDVIFRFETLLWGGDEAAFVLPAWAVPKLLETMARTLKPCPTDERWILGGQGLTHKVGIFITDRKTPIALARKVAEALANSAKVPFENAPAVPNVAQIMVSESVEPPLDIDAMNKDALARYREYRYCEGDPRFYQAVDEVCPGRIGLGLILWSRSLE